MTDTTIHPIPKGTRVNVTKFQHASGMKCTGAPDSPHEVLTIDEIYNEGEYRLRMEGSGLCCHAAFQFVSPYVEPAEDNTPEPAEAAERFVTPYKDTPRESVDDTGNPAPWPVDVEGPSDVLSAIAATLTEGLRDAIPHSPGCGRWARIIERGADR